MLPGRDGAGRPKKRQFGPWMLRAFKLLARGKALRGTPFDPFGYSAERRAERALIAEYQADMARLLQKLPNVDAKAALGLAELPLQIRGFGPVKAQSIAAAAKRRAALWARLDAAPVPVAAE